MMERPGSGSLDRSSSFQESGAVGQQTGEFNLDTEAMIQKVRYIKKRILEIENADMAPTVRTERPGRQPGTAKKIPKTSAVVDKKKCVGCGICIDCCPEQAISTKGQVVMGEIVIDSGKCIACGTCVSACPNEAISLPQLAKTVI
jgi:ferredoxin